MIYRLVECDGCKKSVRYEELMDSKEKWWTVSEIAIVNMDENPKLAGGYFCSSDCLVRWATSRGGSMEDYLDH